MQWDKSSKLNKRYGEKSFTIDFRQYMVTTDPNIYVLEKVEVVHDLFSSVNVVNLQASG